MVNIDDSHFCLHDAKRKRKDRHWQMQAAEVTGPDRYSFKTGLRGGAITNRLSQI